MLNWNWENQIGELYTKDYEGKEIKISIYEGNAPFIGLYEFDDDGVTKYTMYTFFIDLEHAKRCITDNISKDWTKLRLWKINTKLEKIAKQLYIAGCDIEILHSKPTPEGEVL